MIPAYISFVVDNTRNNNTNNTHIADDIEMSSIHSNDDDDDEYLINYDKDWNHQQNIMTTNNVMQDVITNIDDHHQDSNVMHTINAVITNLDIDDDDTMETIIRTPEYNESSRIMMMLADVDGFGCIIDSSKKDDNCYINTNNGSNYNYKYNYNSRNNYNCDNKNTCTNNNNSTNIISYECGSLFEEYDDAIMFPSETIITMD